MVRQKVEESVPVQEVKAPAFFSVKHFSKSVLIVLFSFFCIFAGVLIYQLSTPVDDFEAIKEKPKVNQSVPAKNNRNSRASVVFQRSQKMSLPLKKEEPEVMLSAPSESIKQENASQEAKIPVLQNSVDEPVIKMPEPSLKLEDALKLRDHLAMGQSCLEDLKVMMKTPIPSSETKDALIEKLMPICTAKSFFYSMEDTFYRDRKKALMTYYRLNNPLWLAYLKTLGARLVDIRELNPAKEKPKDIISMAQNALMVKDLKETIQKIQKLPPEIQSDFTDFIEQAKAYLSAQKEVENLILSFARKGV